jgi:hypothetical protein
VDLALLLDRDAGRLRDAGEIDQGDDDVTVRQQHLPLERAELDPRKRLEELDDCRSTRARATLHANLHVAFNPSDKPPVRTSTSPSSRTTVQQPRTEFGRTGQKKDGKHRSTTVTHGHHGHSKTHAELGRNALTRLGEDLLVGVRFPQLHDDALNAHLAGIFARVEFQHRSRSTR